MVQIQIVSDLHIEFNENDIDIDPLKYIIPSTNILILAGDIGSLYKYEQLYTFLYKICIYFEYVIYVPGNHEYYVTSINNTNVDNYKKYYSKKNMNELNQNLYKLENSIKNLYILKTNSIIIDDICIVGCTLWSDLKIQLPKFIVKIYELETEKYIQLYEKDVEYIKHMIKYAKEKKLKLVVVTHYCPTYKILELYNKNSRNRNDEYKSLYVSDLDYLLKSDMINTWISGHTHYNYNFITKGGTKVVSNQYGKPKDNIQDYSKKFILNI
jgi:predicted phosphohydrolase